MENIEITFLGTSGSIPTKTRNHSAILVKVKNDLILVDAGEGVQRQFRLANLSPSKLNKILITHWHGDHTLGLPGLLQTLSMNEYSKKLEIYGPKGTKEKISFLEKAFGKFNLDLEIKEISSQKIDFKDYIIETKTMNHATNTNAYSIILKDKVRLDKKKIEKLKLPNSPLLGELQKGKDIVFNKKKIKAKEVTYIEKGKKLTIILDTLPNKNSIDLAKNSDLLITECTFSINEKETAKEYYHLTSIDAAQIAKKSKSKQLLLTHISERYEKDLSMLKDEAIEIFKNTSIAKELSSYKI